jgi:hypothetical protein
MEYKTLMQIVDEIALEEAELLERIKEMGD